jgi:hypothetical protein
MTSGANVDPDSMTPGWDASICTVSFASGFLHW